MSTMLLSSALDEKVMDIVVAIDPYESANMPVLLAFEWTHAGPRSLCVNDMVKLNMKSISVTLDTSHFERLLLNAAAPWNVPCMFFTRDTSHFESSLSNGSASESMWLILVTLDTSQFERSLLNAVASENM